MYHCNLTSTIYLPVANHPHHPGVLLSLDCQLPICIDWCKVPYFYCGYLHGYARACSNGNTWYVISIYERLYLFRYQSSEVVYLTINSDKNTLNNVIRQTDEVPRNSRAPIAPNRGYINSLHALCHRVERSTMLWYSYLRSWRFCL